MKKYIQKIKNYFSGWTPFQKRYIPTFVGLGLAFLLSIIFIFTLPVISHNLLTDPKNKSSRSGWPTRVAAPYIDMSGWVDTASAYSINGVADLKRLSQESGFPYFNLGFIQPDQTTPLESNGTIRWGWGGYYTLGEAGGQNSSQYKAIHQSIKSLRDSRGDYTISVGGQVGKAPWVVTQDINALANFYKEIISLYSLKRLDLDIEESNQDYYQNIANAKAIKQVQDETNIEITLTIPIMPSGWQQKQLNIIKAYLDVGVDVALFNSMTMCYGTGVYANEDYGTASIRAITNSIAQLKTIYAGYGIALTDDQAYLKTGATFSIGYENELYPTFTLDMANTIVSDAIKHNFGMVSMWSMGRDAMLSPNKAITTQYNYTNILHKYNNDVK